MIGIDLGFDIEPHVAVARLADEIHDFDQCRNPGSRHHVLIRKLRRIGAAGPDLADVVFFYLGQRQLNKGNARWRDIDAVGVAGEVRIEPALMRDHQHAVAGGSDIQLQRIDAHRERVGKGLQGIFGKQSAPTAVGFNIESHSLPMDETTQNRSRDHERTQTHHDGFPLSRPIGEDNRTQKR